MGARLPPNDRPRRGGIKCEFCGRSVPTIQQLRTHQNSLHSKALKAKNKLKAGLKSPVKRPVKKLPTRASQELPEKSDARLANDKQKIGTAKSKETQGTEKLSKEKPKIERKKSIAETATVKSKMEGSKAPKKRSVSKEIDTSESIEKKTEFKCPKCEKVFGILFSAQKHIQKHHSVNSSDSNESISDKIQPITLEYCQFCNLKTPMPHKCPNQPQPGLGLMYECVGCEQQFDSNMLFDVHVSDVHSDNSESMMFPSEEDFNMWKEEMQIQTNCKYLLMGRYNNKQVYRCSNASDDSTNNALFCPSTIICIKLAKGVQTNFYTKHYKHDYEEYVLTDKYKSYTITDLLDQARGVDNDQDDTDLYLQFKKLMESIVLDAAKINIDTLKVLIGKASAMMSILTQYDEDDDFDTTRVASNQIYTPRLKDDVTNSVQSIRNKRKVDSNGLNNRNTFSLADGKDTDKILKELDYDDNSRSSKKSKNSDDSENTKFGKEKVLSQSPSFNDSYKQFIDKSKQEKAMPTRKRNVVKTKMGQFKPSLSPKKRDSIVRKDIEYEVKERKNDCNILILKI